MPREIPSKLNGNEISVAKDKMRIFISISQHFLTTKGWKNKNLAFNGRGEWF